MKFTALLLTLAMVQAVQLNGSLDTTLAQLEKEREDLDVFVGMWFDEFGKGLEKLDEAGWKSLEEKSDQWGKNMGLSEDDAKVVKGKIEAKLEAHEKEHGGKKLAQKGKKGLPQKKVDAVKKMHKKFWGYIKKQRKAGKMKTAKQVEKVIDKATEKVEALKATKNFSDAQFKVWAKEAEMEVERLDKKFSKKAKKSAKAQKEGKGKLNDDELQELKDFKEWCTKNPDDCKKEMEENHKDVMLEAEKLGMTEDEFMKKFESLAQMSPQEEKQFADFKTWCHANKDACTSALKAHDKDVGIQAEKMGMSKEDLLNKLEV